MIGVLEELTYLLLIVGEASPLPTDGFGGVGDLVAEIAGSPAGLGEDGVRSTGSLRLTIIVDKLEGVLGNVVLPLQGLTGIVGFIDLDGGEGLDPSLVLGRSGNLVLLGNLL